jgi:hypothetical protein
MHGENRIKLYVSVYLTLCQFYVLFYNISFPKVYNILLVLVCTNLHLDHLCVFFFFG